MGIALFAALAAATFVAPPVPDGELAELRGGFALPGGLNVAIAIQTDTKVDGSLLLRTVYRVDQGTPTLVAFAPEATTGLAKAAGAETSATNAPQAGGVTVMFDRQNGPRIGSSATAAPLINIASNGQSDIAGAPADTAATHLPANGASVAVPAGQLMLVNNQGKQRVQLQGDQLDVSHLVGNAIGSVISNSGSDRVIDTATTVALDISGANAGNLGSAMLKIDTLATDATALMMPR